MILTRKQEEGLRIAIQNYKAGKKYTVISGYAGTGKTTLVRFIIEALGIEEEDICYCAFTGKAAEVLRKKGNKNSCTLHKLLFESIPKPNGGFLRKRKPTIDYKFIVVDEVSMVPKELMDILFHHQCYVLCLGDPGQLPPINKDDDNHLLDKPDIFLDEIMRQAAESEIIRLTMKIRNQEPIPYMNGNDVKVLRKSELNTGMLTWADQILVATNKQKNTINTTMRQLLNKGDDPSDGDKVICTRNYWDDVNEDGDALINGSIGYLKNPFKTFFMIPSYVIPGRKRIDILNSEFIGTDGITYGSFDMDYNMILSGEATLNSKLKYQLGRNRMNRHLIPYEFAYGYAITTHRSQGSEWDNVLVMEEKFPFDKTEHARWVYTACTRCSQKLVLIR